MSNLTYLNDASVLHNLKQRYYTKLIYVSYRIAEIKRRKKKPQSRFLFRVFLCAMICSYSSSQTQPESQFGPENITNDHSCSILQTHS